MCALTWRGKFGEPRLVHDTDGLVCIELDGRIVMFPSEAAARFFFEACADVPNLTAENAVLRQWMDEAALHAAAEQVKALTAENETLKVEQVRLKTQLGEIAENAAKAARRAKILAIAIKNKITP